LQSLELSLIIEEPFNFLMLAKFLIVIHSAPKKSRNLKMQGAIWYCKQNEKEPWQSQWSLLEFSIKLVISARACTVQFLDSAFTVIFPSVHKYRTLP
jgi:hypothetical protein